MTSSWTSATSKTPPSAISMSASSSGYASRHHSWSRGCSATGASSPSATSSAAATWSGGPCVQITASPSRSPTASSTPAGSRPGSMTMTSSSSPMIQALVPSDGTCSIRAVIGRFLPVWLVRRPFLPQEPEQSCGMGEGDGGVRDELDRDGGQQQSGDPGHQLDAVVGQQPVDDQGETHGQPDRQGHRGHRPGQGEPVTGAVNALDVQHSGHDRAGSGQQRGAERDEGPVGPPALGLGGLPRLPGEQLQRDQQQEQAARPLQGGQANPQVVQDRPAEQRERHDYAEGHDGGLPGQLVAVLPGPAAGQPEEDRHRARRVDDYEQRDEDFPEELHGRLASGSPEELVCDLASAVIRAAATATAT